MKRASIKVIEVELYLKNEEQKAYTWVNKWLWACKRV